ncbi:MAG: hypothetical protein EBT13_12560 [Rhodobacteraceae bacterium]|nr:hypothetical protein [Paracoccaceae bacterium]
MSPDQFKFACMKAGIYRKLCGLSVRDLLKALKRHAITAGESRAGTTVPEFASMGLAIKAGMARYQPDEKRFLITPDGEAWLQELEAHGLA